MLFKKMSGWLGCTYQGLRMTPQTQKTQMPPYRIPLHIYLTTVKIRIIPGTDISRFTGL